MRKRLRRHSITRPHQGGVDILQDGNGRRAEYKERKRRRKKLKMNLKIELARMSTNACTGNPLFLSL